MKVLVAHKHRFSLWTAPDWVVPRLRIAFPEHEFVHLIDYSKIEEEIRDAEVVVSSFLRPEQFAAARCVRWVHSPAAAVHQLLFPELVVSNVALTNAREVHAPVVAEHVIAQIFALAKQIPSCVRYQQQRIWAQQLLWDSAPRPQEVMGSTLGLVGLGAIGNEVVQRANALGMKVIAVREHPEKPAKGVDAVYGPQDLNKLLSQSDFVVLAAPVTPSTQRLINADRLAQMKPSSYLINVGRGALIDELALVDALGKNQIAGAALDVFEQEPLAADSPLWQLENLLITPHAAGLTERLWDRHFALICENLRRYLAGEELQGLVDKARGY